MPHGVPQGRPDSVGCGREAEIATWVYHRNGQIVWGWGREARIATWGATGTAK